jgi:hypothetical protein
MIRRNSPVVPVRFNDDEVVRVARHFRVEAAACLVAIIRDETAPASARANAAEKILLYSDGRPGPAKQIAVADLASLTLDEKLELLLALVTQIENDAPGFWKDVGDPKKIGFVRGNRGPKWPAAAAPHNQRLRRRSGLKNEAAVMRVANADHANERAGEAEDGAQAIEAELPQRTLPIGFLTEEQVKANRRAFERSLLEPYAWRT